MPESLLKIQNLSYSYGKHPVLNALSLTLKEGEIVTLLGSSGTGKSTLFKILAGILPYNGTIHFKGSLTDSLAYMTQEDLLLPWRTVWDNLLLLFELGNSSPPTPFQQEEAKTLLWQLDLEHCAEKYPHQLSGGMRQRVSLARTLLQNRPLLLLDEPLASLDVVLREKIYSLLRQKRNQLNHSILMVTHDFHDAICLSDRILLLNQGSIQKEWLINEEDRESSILSCLIVEEIREKLFQMTI